MEPCASFQSSDSGASFNSAKGKGESDRAQSSPSKPKKKFIKSSTATRDLERESVKHKKGIGGRLIKLLAKCLESTCVDLLSGVVVLTDMVLTCVDIDLRASGATAPTWAFLTCQGCLCFYVWEATADFALKGKQVFRSLDWLLDFGIITASLTEVVFLILGSAVEEVRILKLLRICRVMRLIRFIRKAPSLRELRKLMMMFASVIRTLAWSFLFCFIAMTLWSMVAVELLHPIVQELSAEGVWSDCEGCKESFATIMQSNLTFLKTMLAGDSWGEVAVPVMRKQPLTIIVFAGALVSIVYGILNLIVAVIVDAAVEQREKDITTLAADLDYELEEDLKLLGRVFKQVDLNEDGELSLDELVTGAESVPEFASRLRVMDIDAAELEQLFHILDEDGGGSISKDEFKFALSRWMRESKTASHFVKYMVSNLSNNQNHLHEQVKQIVKAVSALQSEIRCLQDEPEGSPCFGSAVAQPSQPTIPAQFSSQNKSMCGVARSPIADNLLSSQLPTLLQRIDESSASDAPPAQPVADLGKDRMSKLLQDVDQLLLKKQRLIAATDAVDWLLRTKLEEASIGIRNTCSGQYDVSVDPEHSEARCWRSLQMSAAELEHRRFDRFIYPL